MCSISMGNQRYSRWSTIVPSELRPERSAVGLMAPTLATPLKTELRLQGTLLNIMKPEPTVHHHHQYL